MLLYRELAWIEYPTTEARLRRAAVHYSICDETGGDQGYTIFVLKLAGILLKLCLYNCVVNLIADLSLLTKPEGGATNRALLECNLSV